MRTNRFPRWLALLVVLALVAAACSDDDSDDAGPDPTPTTAADEPNGDDPPDDDPNGDGPSGEIAWTQSGSLQEGRLTVPLDHDDPDGETIEIAVVRRPAEDPDERIGSILVNPGGPGGSGIELAAFFGFLFPSEIRDHFDLVTWDPRGVGQSTQVRCGDAEFMDRYVSADPIPATPEAEAEVADLMRQFAELCEQDSGDLLPHITTVASARDMDAIREALGEEQITYVGFSYGTFLGATYAELFPDRIRAVVLDGAYSRSVALGDKSAGQAIGFEGSVQAFLEWCQPERCGLAAGGDPGSTLDRVMGAVAREPLPTDDRDGRELTHGLAWTGVLAAMYTPELWGQLDRALTDAREGDGTGLLSLADYYNERLPDGEYSTLHYAFIAYNCMDSPVPTSEEEEAIIARVLEAAPRVGPVFVSAPSPCEFWPVPATGTSEPFSVPSDAPPILVIGTTGDPATPYEWSVQLVEELATAELLTVEGDGHTAFGSGNRCVDDIVTRYLVDIELPSAELECAA